MSIIPLTCFWSILGSGSLAAMSVFESRYKPDLEVKSLETLFVMMWLVHS